MKKEKFGGGITVPTETGFVDETLKLLERWDADAVRDCDGTAMPDEIKRAGYKIYSTYVYLKTMYLISCRNLL